MLGFQQFVARGPAHVSEVGPNLCSQGYSNNLLLFGAYRTKLGHRKVSRALEDSAHHLTESRWNGRAPNYCANLYKPLPLMGATVFTPVAVTERTCPRLKETPRSHP